VTTEVFCKNWYLRDSIAAITLYPFIFYNTNHRLYKTDLDTLRAHEMVHIEQVERLGWFKFYASYVWKNRPQWLGGVKYGEGKYEREAYDKEHL
jgi:hypothetical protein